MLVVFPVLCKVADFSWPCNAGKGRQNKVLDNWPEDDVWAELFRVLLTEFKELMFGKAPFFGQNGERVRRRVFNFLPLAKVVDMKEIDCSRFCLCRVAKLFEA